MGSFTSKNQCICWMIFEYVIDRIQKQFQNQPSVNWGDYMIGKLVDLQSQMKESFTEVELHDLLVEMREGPGLMGPDPQSNIQFLCCLVNNGCNKCIHYLEDITGHYCYLDSKSKVPISECEKCKEK